MLQPELLVFKAHEKFGRDGELIDAPTAQRLAAYLVAFAAWVRRFVSEDSEKGVR